MDYPLELSRPVTKYAFMVAPLAPVDADGQLPDVTEENKISCVGRMRTFAYWPHDATGAEANQRGLQLVAATCLPGLTPLPLYSHDPSPASPVAGTHMPFCSTC